MDTRPFPSPLLRRRWRVRSSAKVCRHHAEVLVEATAICRPIGLGAGRPSEDFIDE